MGKPNWWAITLLNQWLNLNNDIYWHLRKDFVYFQNNIWQSKTFLRFFFFPSLDSKILIWRLMHSRMIVSTHCPSNVLISYSASQRKDGDLIHFNIFLSLRFFPACFIYHRIGESRTWSVSCRLQQHKTKHNMLGRVCVHACVARTDTWPSVPIQPVQGQCL